MPSRPPRLPAELGEVFSVEAALGFGVSERQLRHPQLRVPFRGVRVQPQAIARITESARRDLERDVSPATIDARSRRAVLLLWIQAYAHIALPHFFFSHVSAAAIWNLPLPVRTLSRTGIRRRATPIPWSPDLTDVPDIDVAVLAPHRAPRADGIRGRQLSPTLATARDHDGLRVASPASTWAQLATVLELDELIAAGDALVNEPRVRGVVRGASGSGLATIAQLERAIGAGRRLGAERLREALPLIRVGSASQAETDLRLALFRGGLPEPTLDMDVIGPNGAVIGFTEFAYPAYRVLIEYEGDHHRVDRAQWHRDIEKHALCVAAGWNPVRLTAHHLYPRPDEAVRQVRDALLRAGWRPDRRFA